MGNAWPVDLLFRPLAIPGPSRYTLHMTLQSTVSCLGSPPNPVTCCQSQWRLGTMSRSSGNGSERQVFRPIRMAHSMGWVGARVAYLAG